MATDTEIINALCKLHAGWRGGDADRDAYVKAGDLVRERAKEAATAAEENEILARAAEIVRKRSDDRTNASASSTGA
jgi:hypothetical protein